MDDLHTLQKIAVTLYTADVAFLFFYSWWRRKKITLGSLETTLLPLAIFLSIVFTLNFPFSNSIPLLVLGLGLYVGGSVLVKIAFLNLGWVNSDDFWLARFENRHRYLATTGPYKYLRHPIYMASAISYLGLVLVFLHPVSIVVGILAFTLIVITALNEEKFMQSKFPDYKEYTKRTGRFFPKILK